MRRLFSQYYAYLCSLMYFVRISHNRENASFLASFQVGENKAKIVTETTTVGKAFYFSSCVNVGKLILSLNIVCVALSETLCVGTISAPPLVQKK